MLIDNIDHLKALYILRLIPYRIIEKLNSSINEETGEKKIGRNF